jgi:hypothetical protein
MNKLTMEQQFRIEQVKREVSTIEDLDFLKKAYLDLVKLNIEMVNTYTELLAKEWGVSK